MTITRRAHPCVVEVDHTGNLVKGIGIFGAGSGSRFVWREEVDLPLGRPGGLGWYVVQLSGWQAWPSPCAGSRRPPSAPDRVIAQPICRNAAHEPLVSEID